MPVPAGPLHSSLQIKRHDSARPSTASSESERKTISPPKVHCDLVRLLIGPQLATDIEHRANTKITFFRNACGSLYIESSPPVPIHLCRENMPVEAVIETEPVIPPMSKLCLGSNMGVIKLTGNVFNTFWETCHRGKRCG